MVLYASNFDNEGIATFDNQGQIQPFQTIADVDVDALKNMQMTVGTTAVGSVSAVEVNQRKDLMIVTLDNGTKFNINNQVGGKPHKKHNGRTYVVRTGSRGGKYILVKGKKVYV